MRLFVFGRIERKIDRLHFLDGIQNFLMLQNLVSIFTTERE